MYEQTLILRSKKCKRPNEQAVNRSAPGVTFHLPEA